MDQPACTRRWFLELGIYAGVVTLCAPESRAQTETPTTPSTILGPYYPVIRPVERDTDLTRLSGHRSRAKGQIVHVAGRILNQRGEPLREARVELWQANAAGRYYHPSDPNPRPLTLIFKATASKSRTAMGGSASQRSNLARIPSREAREPRICTSRLPVGPRGASRRCFSLAKLSTIEIKSCKLSRVGAKAWWPIYSPRRRMRIRLLD